MTAFDDELAKRAQRARDVALFRYALVRQAADPGLSKRDRGELVRQLASVEHAGPSGTPVRVSRPTLDRWVRAWQVGGFDALVPSPREVTARVGADALELAAALKRENPRRTAVQVAAIVARHLGWAPSVRTLQRHFVRLELTTRPDGRAPAAFGRFEAEAPNRRWVADALHGPKVAGRNSYLSVTWNTSEANYSLRNKDSVDCDAGAFHRMFGIIDDHSRLAVGYRWSHSEDTLRLEAALRKAVASRGVPSTLYVDNGAAFVSKQLLRACAVLGIRITHSRPGRPQGRGKIERWFGTVRGQFLAEIAPADGAAGTPVASTDELNTLFGAWVETRYHRRTHTETGQTPLARWHAHFGDGGPDLPTPELLREAFLWAEHRQVTKTATVSLLGNVYQVDAALVGRKVELAYDPFDLTTIEVRWRDKPMGLAVPHRIGRHAHPAATPDTPPPPAPETGIDYLRLVATDRETQRSQGINFTAITGNDPGGSR